jgi:hypothetical protein
LTATPDFAPGVNLGAPVGRENQGFCPAQVDSRREIVSTIVKSLPEQDLRGQRGEKDRFSLST